MQGYCATYEMMDSIGKDIPEDTKDIPEDKYLFYLNWRSWLKEEKIGQVYFTKHCSYR